MPFFPSLRLLLDLHAVRLVEEAELGGHGLSFCDICGEFGLVGEGDQVGEILLEGLLILLLLLDFKLFHLDLFHYEFVFVGFILHLFQTPICI